MVQFQVLFQNLLSETEENYEKIRQDSRSSGEDLETPKYEERVYTVDHDVDVQNGSMQHDCNHQYQLQGEANLEKQIDALVLTNFPAC